MFQLKVSGKIWKKVEITARAVRLCGFILDQKSCRLERLINWELQTFGKLAFFLEQKIWQGTPSNLDCYSRSSASRKNFSLSCPKSWTWRSFSRSKKCLEETSIQKLTVWVELSKKRRSIWRVTGSKLPQSVAVCDESHQILRYWEANFGWIRLHLLYLSCTTIVASCDNLFF